MIKLNKTDYYKVLPLAINIKHNSALVYSIINGDLDAEIFADSIKNPAVALLSWEFSFLLGGEKDYASSKNIYDLIFGTILPDSKDKELILFMNMENWPLLCKILEENGCITISRKMFDFDKARFAEMKNSLAALAENLSVSPMEMDNTNNFGYCIKEGSQTICTCSSVAVGANEAEIDIWTDEKHRNKGYATKTAVSFIEHCLKEGIKPVWSCWPFRVESISLAKKLGFDEAEEIPAIYHAENM